MREVIFRVGLLFFCLTLIVCIGMGASMEDSLIRSTIVFFFFISIVYLFMYVFVKSEENEVLLKTRIVDEILKDDNFDVIHSRIEERVQYLLEEEKKQQLEENENTEETDE